MSSIKTKTTNIEKVSSHGDSVLQSSTQPNGNSDDDTVVTESTRTTTPVPTPQKRKKGGNVIATKDKKKPTITTDRQDDNNQNEHNGNVDDELEGEQTDEKENNSKPKAKKRPSTGTASALNTTYLQLCQDAMVALKDRTGSSLAAIKKWILTQHPDLGGPHFNTRVNQALKNGLTKKRFDKVKGSFKISSSYKEAERAKKRKLATAQAKQQKDKENKEKEKVKKEQEAKLKKEAEEKKKQQSAAEKEKIAKEMAAKAEAERQRAAAEAKAKALAERIRKRKFPMEDTKLHREDKELNVKPPSDVTSRPNLPYFWNLTLPFTDKGRTGKTAAWVLAASKVEALDFGSRGLVSDLLQVYHFFRGDVQFSLSADNSEPIVAEFSLQQLVHATEQIINGNTRKAKVVPPLITHLFVTCLQLLWQKPPENQYDDGQNLSKNERQLRNDFHKYLLPSLTPVSWSDLCFIYMDAMERYYTTDTSRDGTVLQPLPFDAEYILGFKNQMNSAETQLENTLIESNSTATGPANDALDSQPLPEGYTAYLGDSRGVLFRAHHKLSRQDPWNLTAEELMALLRALTDDVLAHHPSVALDIAAREEKMNELLKTKKLADSKFRKMRLAFEGPKRPNKKIASASKESEKESQMNTSESKIGIEKDDDTNGQDHANAGNQPFKPTVSKAQFEAAKKAQEKANDAYEKGIRKLVARTEPIGFDRNFNAVYCFRHDPEILYIEDRRPPSGLNSHFPESVQFPRFSWHFIASTSLFDLYTSSLDVRGKREADLYDELLGPLGSHQSLRRFLHDDVKEQQLARAKIKEKEALLEKLKIAKIKCDEEKGRRSGRLAGNAESELVAIQDELDCLEKAAEGKNEVPPKNYKVLLGVDALVKFEKGGKMETRRSRDKKSATNRARDIPLIPCSKLIGTGNIDGTGTVGMIVSDLLELEEFCESLVPWDRGNKARKAWIARLEDAVYTWNSISSDLFTLLEQDDLSEGDSQRRESIEDSQNAKRKKSDSSAGPSVATVVSQLKQPLLELEERLADVMNVVVATRDTELADENMSVDGTDNDQAEKSKLEKVWKKAARKVRETPTKNYFPIREHVVTAISAARKAHLPEVVSKLRAALLMWHPNAAGDCKGAVVKLLEEYGEDMDDDDESDDEADEKDDSADDEPATSVLCAEGIILSSCLETSRSDWISAVKSEKTISRLAALAAAFTKVGTEKLTKLQAERDALDEAITIWTKEGERRQKKIQAGKKAVENDFDGPSEVWANVEVKDEIIMAKAEKYPWWPAKKCEPKDPKIAAALSSLDRCLVAMIGEMGGLRVVKADQIVPFTGKRIDDDDALTEQTREIKQQLDECLAIGRRILRGRSKKKAR